MSLGELIKQHSLKSFQSIKVTSLMEAEVIAAPPELKIKIKGNDKLIIPKELIVVSQHLCKHKRKVTIKNDGKTDLTGGKPSVSMSVQGYQPHVHQVSKVDLTSATLTSTEAEVEFLDELKQGDSVMVASFEGGQKFFILDRIVTY
ncbi:DUF2577 family protein [Brevibacillus dissolubilis]|uniref:DUF2577 family protein n=1 Tax=Brevibacillus dissolubilis TaxID=1844116 RepID=UPI00159BC355|nr:DUF2577 family protein [Brevibacillus dissolubilis]